eukprot:40555-Chlamydomonas_euryale.AAC.4
MATSQSGRINASSPAAHECARSHQHHPCRPQAVLREGLRTSSRKADATGSRQKVGRTAGAAAQPEAATRAKLPSLQKICEGQGSRHCYAPNAAGRSMTGAISELMKGCGEVTTGKGERVPIGTPEECSKEGREGQRTGVEGCERNCVETVGNAT